MRSNPQTVHARPVTNKNGKTGNATRQRSGHTHIPATFSLSLQPFVLTRYHRVFEAVDAVPEVGQAL